MRYCLIAICGLLVACSPLWKEHRAAVPRSSLLVFTISVDTTHSSPGDTRILLRLENISPLVLAVGAPECYGFNTHPVAEDSAGHQLQPRYLFKLGPCGVEPKRLEPGASVEVPFVAPVALGLEELFTIEPGTGIRVHFVYYGVITDENGRDLCGDDDVLVSNTLVLD